MRSALFALVLTLTALTRPATARGDDASAAHAAPHGHHHHEHARPPSISMGYANGGQLRNGVLLEEDDTVRYMPGRHLHYATDQLVGLLHRTARAMFRRHHLQLTVGDLSAAHGGVVGHHASHQSGRDADVAFFVLDRHDEPVRLTDYVHFGRDGSALDGDPVHFDVARNWSLAEALLDDPSVHVEHIFVSSPIRALLLEYAHSHGVAADFIARAESTMHQPARGNPHNDHFHVRINCPSEDGACRQGVRILAHRHPRHLARDAHHRHEASRGAHAPDESARAEPVSSSAPPSDTESAPVGD